MWQFKSTIAFSFLFFLITAVSAQFNEDSLLHIANNTLDDSIKYRHYFKLVKVNKFKDLEKTKQYTDSIAAIYNRTNNPQYKGVSDYYYGFYYRKKNDYDKAITYYQRAKQIGIDAEYWSIYAVSISEIAGIYTDLGQLAKALEINIEAANFNEQASDVNSKGRLSNNYNAIGLVYGEMGEVDNAFIYYRKAIQVAPKDIDRSVPYGNMAELFLLENQTDSLLIYAEKCHRLEAKLNDARGIAYSEWLRAEAYFKVEKYDLAEQSARKSIDLYTKYPEKILMLRAYYVLGKALAKNGKKQLAKENILQGIKMSKSIQNLNLLVEGQLLLTSLYEENGDYDLALKTYKSYISNIDSLNELKEFDKFQDLSFKYEAAQKSEKIAAQQLALVKKETQTRNLLAGLFLLAALSTFVYYRFRIKQKIAAQEIALLKKDKKLLAIDYIVQGQEEERKRIAQDLHDGLGGILSTAKIQMRNIQKEIDKLEDLKLIDKTEALISSAYDEVRRISHDMMPGALVNLGLFAAIEDLAEDVNLNEKLKVRTQWYTSDKDIPESAHPIIYRIVQEVITNALKYAKASTLQIEMTQSKNSFELSIKDDGIGFDLNKIEGQGLGLKSIKSRVNYLNGEIEIITAPGKGTEYEISFPSIS